MRETREKPGKDLENESGNDPKISRRKFLKRALLNLAGISILSLGWYSFLYEPGNIALERHYLYIPNLPQYWEGRKLILVSDIHSSIIVGHVYIRKAFSMIIAEKPDILVMAGDFVTGPRTYMDPLARELKKLITDLENTEKIAILGNHDYWSDADYVKKGLRENRFNILVNEKIRVGPHGSYLTLLGSDDMWMGIIDIPGLLEGVDLQREAVILLSHNPDVFPMAVENNVPIVLAGHSHGGQINLPFIGPPILPCKYAMGFYRKGNSLLYVNRGLGTILFPLRFNCSPEITVFTLKGV